MHSCNYRLQLCESLVKLNLVVALFVVLRALFVILRARMFRFFDAAKKVVLRKYSRVHGCSSN